MPLHLLPKKSWHVYNSANIARVRADETAAAAEEERQEQRMQEVDAARRLAILRGETPPLLEDDIEEGESTAVRIASKEEELDTARRGEKRKRKRRGEDDTDFEMRVAREREEVASQARHALVGPRVGDAAQSRTKREDVSIVDERGHIDLFGPPADPASRPREGRKEKNPEAEREKAEERARQDVTMRFVDAGGRGADGLKGKGPWYSKRGAGDMRGEVDDGPGTDAFGRPDAKRKDREVSRIISSDPLAMMKSGAKRVREVEAGRKREREERESELRALRKEERRRARKRCREDRDEEGERDSLDGFSLDAPPREERPRSRDRTRRDTSKERRHDRGHRHRRHDDEDRRHRHRDRDEKDKYRYERDRQRHRSHSPARRSMRA